MSERKYRDKDWLRKKIHDENKLLSEIANQCGVGVGTITRWRKRHGIDGRSNEETQRLLVDNRLRDENWMREKYIDEEKDITDISQICSIGRGTVFRWLDRHGIERRQKGSNPFVDYTILNDSQFLYKKYVKENCTLTDIAEEANCCKGTVSKFLKRHGIEVDDRGSVNGKRNGNYNHGNYEQNRYFGENWEEIRKKIIIERDDNKCQSCGLINSSCKGKYNTSLSVHHITPRNKYRNEDGIIDFDEANKMSNLITLCSKCHTYFERNETEYTEYKDFQGEIKERGDWPNWLIENDAVGYCKIW